ncbi:MAG TPA: hypothetical protein ENG63_04030 [Candidatus Desulfofervidus auxilii]|uniref:PRC-barrel domain containing protein n=1 Tax=Desulfofervidus auxilii TaxID=1621989 RepID=A0A7C0U287_DESA2|nr:hypothetical protein [Candidatus Desulfofervidus auxilii]
MIKNIKQYINKVCDIVMEDGTGAIGKVIKIEKDMNGFEWLIIDYGYGFRIDKIKSISIVENPQIYGYF